MKKTIFYLFITMVMVKAVLLGASLAPSLAHKILKRLQEANYEIFPVNPKYEQIDDTTCFPSLKLLPALPEVVIFMVNPRLSLEMLEQVVALGIRKVWFQPDTFDERVLNYCQEHGISYENQKCLLIADTKALFDFVQQK